MCWTGQGLQCALVTVSAPFVDLVKHVLLDALVIVCGDIFTVFASVANIPSEGIVAEIVSHDTCHVAGFCHGYTYSIAFPVVSC